MTGPPFIGRSTLREIVRVLLAILGVLILLGLASLSSNRPIESVRPTERPTTEPPATERPTPIVATSAPTALPTTAPARTTAPTAAPTPAPTVASGWVLVAQFKGDDGGITKPFTTTRAWRLTFLIEDTLILSIRTYPEGSIVQTVPLKNSRLDGKPQIGSMTIVRAGTYALDLFPIGYYQIDIEEMR